MKKNLIALLTMILALSSCNTVQEPLSDDTLPAAQESSTEIPAEYIPPDVDYGGAAFRVIARGFGKWVCQDMYSEGYNGETINDTVFMRNSYAEELLNFSIEQELVDQDADLFRRITTLVQAGEDACDLVWVGSAEIARLAMQGMLQDMSTIETLDFSHSWWDPKAMENLTINDSVYFTTGEISVISKYAVYVITFNKTLAEEYDLPDLYAMVRDGKWTIDNFGMLSEMVSGDLNGDGKYNADDLYGFMTYNSDLMGFMYGAGASIARMNNGELTTDYNNQNTLDMLSKLTEIKNKNSTYQFGSDDEANKIFIEGRTLFTFRTLINLNFYRDMETDYGILPIPKVSEEQDTYYSGIHAYGVSLIGVPLTAQETERTGVILEVLGQKSQEILTPAFYDKTLKGKYFKDEESGEMLDIIFQSRVYDIGYFCDWGQFTSKMATLSQSKKDTFASTFAAVEDNVRKSLEETIEAFRAGRENMN